MKVLLGLSGGVDSTYAALELKRAGHEVGAAFLRMHGGMDSADAKESALSLGIPFFERDCRDAFDKLVIDDFCAEYSRARTPNPCVICNSEVKFIELCRLADELGYEKIATGHYAGVVKLSDEDGEYYALRRGKDLKKDQTYMLWRLPRQVLSRLILPLSELEKSAIREDAGKEGLSASRRKDSQEICFITSGDYREFVEARVGKFPEGDFVSESGELLGRHNGIIGYTVGQRRGLGISSSARLFVTGIDPESNNVYLSHNDSFATRVEISGIVYSGIREKQNGERLRLSVKLRYASPPKPAEVEFFGDRAVVYLDAPERAVTPGQSCVMYDGDILAAGGFIDSAK